MNTCSDRKEERKEDHSDEKDEKKISDYKTNPSPPPTKTLQPYYLHQWLEAKDTEGTWLEAQIIEIDEIAQKFKIHYKGWKAKYDEWFSMDPNDVAITSRLAPLKTHVSYPQKYGEVKCTVGISLDVLDTTDKWFAAHINDIKHERDTQMVLIAYVGWESKYNEWLNADSYRLAPFRTFTKPVQRQVQSNFSATMDNEQKFRALLREKLNFTIVDQDPDGNCLFRSVSHQVYGDPSYHHIVRMKCMEYIRSESYFFQSYIAEDLHQYVERMKLDGEWGDHVEIQAMSEVYERPIELYAYSATPMKTYRGPASGRVPIRLSYHFQSHYNSVRPVDDAVFRKGHLTNTPGEAEDAAIEKSKLRGPRALQRAQNESDRAATEQEELRLALEISRNQFNQRDANAFELAANQSLLEFTQHSIEVAKKKSMLEYTEQTMLKAVIEKSESELLQKVKKLSLLDEQKLEEENELKQALAVSMKDDDKSNTELKNALQQTTPTPVKLCVDAGFPLEMCIEAYHLFNDPKIKQDIITQNMMNYLVSR